MSFDTSKLSPWRISEISPKIVENEAGTFLANFANQADAERCVLMAAAAEIMQRRGWGVRLGLAAEHMSRPGWMAIGRDLKELPINMKDWADPFTAIVEVEQWYVANTNKVAK